MKIINKFIVSLVSVLVLCEVQASVNEIDTSGRTKLMIELSSWNYGDDLEEISRLILEPSFNPHIKDNQGHTALDYAIKYHVKPIEYILSKKEFAKHYRLVNKESFEEVFGGEVNGTTIVKAVANGSLSQVNKYLSENDNVDLNFELEGGVTPLSAVSLIKDIDIAALMFNELISNGANVNESLVYQNGDTLGHVFCASDNYLLLILAISKGYDINLKNKDGVDVYEYSTRNGRKFCQTHLENIANAKDGKIL